MPYFSVISRCNRRWDYITTMTVVTIGVMARAYLLRVYAHVQIAIPAYLSVISVRVHNSLNIESGLYT